MAEVDFRDRWEAKAWLDAQSIETQHVISSRAALRSLANICEGSHQLDELLALKSMRAILTSAVRGFGFSPEVEWQRTLSAAFVAARSAAMDTSLSDRAVARAAVISAAMSANHGSKSVITSVGSSARSIDQLPIDYSARYTSQPGAFAAATSDTGVEHPLRKSLRRRAVWGDYPAPMLTRKNRHQLITYLQADPKWMFWHDWYLAMWEGTFEDWPLAIEVAKIPDKIWDAGLGAVAAEIERIEAEREGAFDRPASVPELERKKLVEHVKRLLDAPEISALNAEGSAEILERAIGAFKRDAPANCLPEELAHLEDLPGLFRALSTTIKSDSLNKTKQDRLLGQIEALNAKVAELEAALKLANEKTLNGRFKIAAIDSLGKTIGGPWFLGALVLGTSHFFGLSPNDTTWENLRQFVDQLSGAEPLPSSQAGALPSSVEI